MYVYISIAESDDNKVTHIQLADEVENVMEDDEKFHKHTKIQDVGFS